MAVAKTSIVWSFSAEGDQALDRVYVKYFRWVGSTTNLHELLVKDSKNNVLFPSESDGRGFIDIVSIYDIVDGIVVETMDSGTLYAYIR